MTEKIPQVYIRTPAALQIKRGHPWIYQSNIKAYQGHPNPGDLVEVRSLDAKLLGYAYVNPETIIALRMLYSPAAGRRGQGWPNESQEVQRKLDRAFFRRQRMHLDSNAWRWVWSEADGLPGLICDVYREVAVVQFLTQGMEARKDLIVKGLIQRLQPSGIYERSEGAGRKREGLPMHSGWLYQSGTSAPALIQEIQEGPLRFRVQIAQGHKTGFYLDQRAARRYLQQQKLHGLVLDTFAYSGGFTLSALYAGAEKVEAIETSAEALSQLQENAALNGYRDRVILRQEDVFEFLPWAVEQKKRYSAILLDPPAFTRTRAQRAEALRGYRELHRRAAQLLEPAGRLLTCCCSHHISRQDFKQAAWSGFKSVGRQLKFLKTFGPDPDHPEKPQIPESRYLTCILATSP